MTICSAAGNGTKSLTSIGAAGSFLQNFDAAAGADAGGTGCDHFLEIGQRPDAAGGFDAEAVRFHQPTHEHDVINSRAAGAEASGGFDKVSTAGNAKFAGECFLGVGEQASFEDDFADGVCGVTDLGDGLDVGKHGGGVTGFQRADVEDHVNLAGAIANGGVCFGNFGFSEIGTEWKTNDGADFDRCVS